MGFSSINTSKSNYYFVAYRFHRRLPASPGKGTAFPHPLAERPMTRRWCWSGSMTRLKRVRRLCLSFFLYILPNIKYIYNNLYTYIYIFILCIPGPSKVNTFLSVWDFCTIGLIGTVQYIILIACSCCCNKMRNGGNPEHISGGSQ